MKRPKHRKNKHRQTEEEAPVIDERNLVDAEESTEFSFEDRVALYWMENKSSVISSILFLIVAIALFNGFRIYGGYSEEKLQANYSSALNNEQLDSFAVANPNLAIGGFAALSVADAAFEDKDYSRASEFYKLAASSLQGNILAGRAALGIAFSTYQSEKEEGLKQLDSISSNALYSDSTKAEAVYHLAVDALNDGKVEAFDSLLAQISEFKAGSQWSQRLEYYQQQAP